LVLFRKHWKDVRKENAVAKDAEQSSAILQPKVPEKEEVNER